MKTADRHRHATLALAASFVLLSGGCLKTDLIAGAFNQGALDNSGGDPFHDPAELRRDIARRLIKDEITDGFFGQSTDPYVASWLDQAAKQAGRFKDVVINLCCAQGSNIGNACQLRPLPREGAMRETADTQNVRAALLRITQGWAGTDVGTAPFCGAGKLDEKSTGHFADYVRFHAAMERAVRAVAPKLVERIIDPAALEQGAAEAFAEAAAYLRKRRWRREIQRRTTAFVIKGGASTGIYSAGATWVVLHLIDGCMNDEACSVGHTMDYRVKLISGTSTGAMVSTAVDYYNAGKSADDRKKRIEQLGRWFTCYGVNDLYCTHSDQLFDLAKNLDGVLEFRGIEKLLGDAVDCDVLDNDSELLLNTVDFRSGRVFAVSDQDPRENRRTDAVVRSAVASAASPLVVKPVARLPVNYASKQVGTYLDGGVRSEIPLLPVAKRGAERVLLIASAQSVLGETKPLSSAIKIAARYIDVSTGGVAERDYAGSQQYIESARLAEIDACAEILRQTPDRCPAASCNADALCEASFTEVCLPPGAKAPAPTEGSRTYDRVQHLWKLTSIFRDETAVEGLHGYNFDPTELRRLFFAGAEVARVRCMEIARTLGLPVTLPGMRAKITAWCAPELPEPDALCAGVKASDHAQQDKLVTCSETYTPNPGKDCDAAGGK